MICPNCQTPCGDSDHFCYVCGMALHRPKPKTGSRWMPLLLLILMFVGGLISFFATSGQDAPIRAQGDMPWFYVRSGILYFEQQRYTGGNELTVPSEIAGQAVYALGEDCFAGCTQLTSVILPEGLSSIGDGAFFGCTSLRGISIPESVNMIGGEAFSGCSALEAISISSRIRIIREDTFEGCSQLRYIFFNGLYEEWTALYDQFINPDVTIICMDGSFFQSDDRYK